MAYLDENGIPRDGNSEYNTRIDNARERLFLISEELRKIGEFCDSFRKDTKLQQDIQYCCELIGNIQERCCAHYMC